MITKIQPSIQWHVTRIMMALSCVVALLAIGSHSIYEMQSFEKRQRKHIETLVAILGDNAKVVFLFGDQNAANVFLGTLQNDPSIVDAFMLTPDAEVLGAYRSNPAVPLPSFPHPLPQTTPVFDKKRNGVLTIYPIVQKGIFLGALYLKINDHELRAFLWQLWVVSGFVLIGILAVAFFLSRYLQRSVSEPIVALDEATKAIAQQQDFSVHVPVQGQKEIASLYESFNVLLAHLKEREQQRDQTEQDLQQKEQRYRLVTDHVPIMIALVNMSQEYMLVNPAYEKFVHQSGQGLIGRHIGDFWGEATFRQMESDLQRAYQGNIVSFLKQVKLPHDTEAWVDGLYVPVMSEEGQVEGLYVFLEDVTNRKQADDDLHDSIEETRALNRRIYTIQERERTVLSQNLHDSVGQLLTVLHLNLTRLEQGAMTPPTVQYICKDSQLLLKEIVNNVRNISIELHPALLEDLGLAAAIQWYVENQAKRTGWSTYLFLDDTILPVPPTVRLVAYRVVQEALINVLRHAEASSITVRLWQERQILRLLIEDNGHGFEWETSVKQITAPSHLGLLGMIERTRAVGGTLEIISRLGQGTKILGSYPLDSAPVSPMVTEETGHNAEEKRENIRTGDSDEKDRLESDE